MTSANEQPSTSTVILEVPYPERTQVKELGAWWDPKVKKWFVPRGRDPEPFRRWFPKGSNSEAAM
jgi:hypothetical protein